MGAHRRHALPGLRSGRDEVHRSDARGVVSRQAFRLDPKTKELFDVGEPNLKAGEFLDLFGGDQIMAELISLIDCPTFAAAWSQLCEKWGSDPKWKGYTKMRLLAFRGNETHNAEMKRQAWQMMMASLSANGQDHFPAEPSVIKGQR